MSKQPVLTLVFIALAMLILTPSAGADERPVQLSLVTPIQIFPEEDDITGIRFNLIYGRNATVTGLDLGLANHCTAGVSKGFQHGLVGIVDADFVGWQNSVVNVTHGDFEGLQWGFMNYAGHASGLQLGIVNYAERLHGLQIGFINIIQQGGQFPVFPIVNWSFEVGTK